MTKSRSRLTGTAVGATIALLLTSCTGSNSSSTGSTSGSPGTAQPPSGSASTSIASSGTTSGVSAPDGINITIAPDVEDVGDLAPDAYSTTPIPEAQITSAIGQVDGIAQDVMNRSGIPGMAVAVVHGGKVVFAKGFGVREVGKPELVDENTVFQLASVSKSLGASVIAHAVGEGTVKWSDPIVKYLPDFRLADPSITPMVTIGDLYAHRSGIPAGAGDDLEGIGFTRDQIIEKLRYFPLNPFRISYGYTNFGMTTGGEAVAAAAGMSWEDLSQQLLYEPLGMTATSSRYADYVAQPNRAIIHFNDNGTFKALYTRDADAQSPAGGVSSNVTDMAKWMEMNLASGQVNGEQVIDADALLEGHTPQVVNHRADEPDTRSRFYGYGVNVETTSTGQVKWGHSGAFYVGTGTAYAMLPGADVGIVALTNASPVGAAEAVTTSFTDLVRTGRIERDWLGFYAPQFATLFVNHSPVATTPAPASPAPARPAADYAATYSNEVAGDVVVTANGETLTVTIGPKQLSATLDHYDGDVFSLLPPGGNGDPLSAVTFAGNPGGLAQTVQIEFLDAYKFGTFTRTA